MNTHNSTSRWKVDRHIPIAVIMVLLAHLFTFIWYASKFDSRLGLAENDITSLDQSVSELNHAIAEERRELQKSVNETNSRLVRLETIIEERLPRSGDEGGKQ